MLNYYLNFYNIVVCLLDLRSRKCYSFNTLDHTRVDVSQLGSLSSPNLKRCFRPSRFLSGRGCFRAYLHAGARPRPRRACGAPMIRTVPHTGSLLAGGSRGEEGRSRVSSAGTQSRRTHKTHSAVTEDSPLERTSDTAVCEGE